MTFPGKRLGPLIFAFFWTLLVLYPRPADLLTSIHRLFIPPTDPQAVEKLIPLLPSSDNPALVEDFILQEFPYRYDWLNYNRPWYFPTAAEALEKNAGDCKTRFIILASTLEALGISYETFISPYHIWVYYEGKTENSIENKEAVLLRSDGGKIRVKFPEIKWQESSKIFYEAFWEKMPFIKKVNLICGVLFSVYFYMITLWDIKNTG